MTFDFDNPITGSLSKDDKAEQIYTEGAGKKKKSGLVRLGGSRQKESHAGGGYGGRQRLPLSPSVVLWRA